MAQAAEDHKEKALWLTMAQSWVRLAEHAARAGESWRDAADGDDVLAVNSSE